MSWLESRRYFFHLLWFTLLLKLAWAAYLPLTGDEVYFFIWGKYPGMGYYDHPPMIGWWLSLLLWFGDANWWLRMPALLLGNALALGIYLILRTVVEESRAVLGGMLFLLSPLALMNVFVTTDTPLIAFSFLSAWAFQYALRRSEWRWYLLSGLLLGAAFLAKYFAVLLGLAYGFYLLTYRRNRHDMLGLLWLFLAVLPFAALNIWWNADHCWNNILFNIFNRHSEGGVYLLEYLLMLLYMVTPPLLWYGWRGRSGLWQSLRQGELFAFLWLLPLLLFLLLSFKARIGLHWVLAFYPFLFLALVPLLSAAALRHSVKFIIGFSLFHMVMAGAILSQPHEVWRGKSFYEGILIGFYTEEFVDQYRQKAAGYHWAAGSYVDSAMLEYASGTRFIVFGDGSKYGRHDDQLTDWRGLEGENIAVLVYNPGSANGYRRFFAEAEVLPFSVQGRDYYLVRGRGFQYQRYRQEMLTMLRDSYYQIPPFLPMGECYFTQRYFADEDAVR